jgi:phenylpyruvate tautomerase PptA (4-oxalocrotonate tautomerase family)
MPMIDFTLQDDALTDEAREQLVADMTSALIKYEGAPDNEYVRSITWCFVDRRPARDVVVGGDPGAQPVYRVVMTVPEGTPGLAGPLNEGRRAKLVRHVTELVLRAEGTEPTLAESRRVWVQIREIPDGFWGGFGEIAHMDDIAAYATGESPGDPSTGRRFREAFDASRERAPA